MRIKTGRAGFNYGNCFVLAIGQAFRIKQSLLEAMFRLIGVNTSEGATTKQCDKVIKELAKYRKKTARATGKHFHISWGAGTEGQTQLNNSLALARDNKIKPIIIT